MEELHLQIGNETSGRKGDREATIKERPGGDSASPLSKNANFKTEQLPDSKQKSTQIFNADRKKKRKSKKGYLSFSSLLMGTSGHGLAGMVVLGGWLDLTILEVFSNLNDSMIYYCEN